ncbi:class I SAM-dependent methyltransferase [Parafrankia elaeagni]|uniref:class I SAM-dependent methyltransferase n=1 Tax=Parafrankia elaeagni TaxID=222534 RepID=UPI00037F2A27|nr:class I SAM-dependent methyltransferase [Parafrankia elaeagni]
MTAEADDPNDHHPNDRHPNDRSPDDADPGDRDRDRDRDPGYRGPSRRAPGGLEPGDADGTAGRWFRPTQNPSEPVRSDSVRSEPVRSEPAQPGEAGPGQPPSDAIRAGSLPSVSPPPSLFTPRAARRSAETTQPVSPAAPGRLAPPASPAAPGRLAPPASPAPPGRLAPPESPWPPEPPAPQPPSGYPVTPGTSATFDPLQDPVVPARAFEVAAAEREPVDRRGDSSDRTGPDAETSSKVHGSLAEIAVDAYDGGDHAAEPGEITERTLVPLLLHSLTDLREIWIPLLEASGARSVAEVGSESGATTSLLVNLLRRGGGGRLVVIDPEPGVAPTSGGGLDVEVICGYSPEALDGHAPTDAYLIDGDHNYATVRGELEAIGAAVRDFDRTYFPLVILHDVGWPAGRRDQYYSPDRIPEADRQPNSWDVGVEIDKADAVPGRGFRGMGAFAWALTEGGPRNGVRTAVEDFAAEHPDLRFITVAPVFGLGVLLDRRAPWARRVADLLAPWVSNTLLSRMERNRIDLYLRVLALQDDAVAAARGRQREWARLDAERSELAARDLQRLNRISELEQELAAARRQPRPPWAPATPDERKIVTAARIARAALRSRLGDDPATRDPGAPAGSGRPGSAAVVRLGAGLSRFVEHRGPGGSTGSSRKPTGGDPGRRTPGS